MTICPDCSEELTCAEVTAPDGRKFITACDVEGAARLYRPSQGYSVRVITGRRCNQPANHW